jgi:hypothetical protein
MHETPPAQIEPGQLDERWYERLTRISELTDE